MLLSLLLACVLILPAAGQGGPPITLAEYQARLQAARARLAAAPPTNSAPAVQALAAELAAIDAVQLPDGASQDLAPLVRENDTRDEALARVDAVLAQLSGAQRDDAPARFAALERVLSSEALNGGEGFFAWLRRLLAGSGGAGADGAADAAAAGIRAVDLLLSLVGGLVAVWLIGRIVQAGLGAFLKESALREEGAGGVATVASTRRRAAELASAGSYRAAVRQLYLATLLSLEEHDLLRIDRSLTNREVLASVAHQPQVQAGLRPVVDVFERVWYGEREPDQATFERYEHTVQAAAEAIEAGQPRTQASPAAVEAA